MNWDPLQLKDRTTTKQGELQARRMKKQEQSSSVTPSRSAIYLLDVEAKQSAEEAQRERMMQEEYESRTEV